MQRKTKDPIYSHSAEASENTELNTLRQEIANLRLENEAYKKALLKSNAPQVAHNKSDLPDLLLERLQINMILDNTEEAFIVIDKGLRIISFNRSAGEKANQLIGHPFEIGSSILSMVEPSRLEFVKELYNEVLSGIPKSYKFTSNPSGSAPYYFQLNYKPITNDEGEVIAIMIIAKDITTEEYALKELSSADNKFRSLVQDGGDLIAILTEKAEYTYVSPTATKILGYAPDDLVGNCAFNYVHPDDLEKSQQVFNELSNTKQITIPPFRFKNKNGDWHWLESIITNLLDDPAINGIVVNSRDVTQQISLIQELKNNEQSYSSLFYNHPDAVFSVDVQGNFVSVNSIMVDYAEISRENILSQNFSNFILVDDLPRVELHFAETLKGRPQNFVARVVSASGKIMSANITSMPIVIDEVITGIYGIAENITDKIKMEENLAKLNADLSKIMDASVDVICTVDEQGRFIKVSAASENVWGYKPAELIGKEYLNYVYEEDRAKSMQMAESIMQGSEISHFENRYVKSNGKLVPVIWSARWDETDRIMYCIARDATQSQKVSIAIQQERERYAALFMKAPAFICTLIGPQHTYQMVNPGYKSLTGKKELLGKTIREAFPELAETSLYENLDDVYRTGKSFIGKELLLQIDRKGTGIKEDIYINFIYQAYRNADNAIEGIFVFGVDVTDQVLAREQIKLSEIRQRSLFLFNPMPMWLYDTTTLRFLDVNEAAINHYKYTREEFLSMSVKDIRPAVDRDKVEKFIANNKDQPILNKGSWQHLKKDGSIIDVEITSHLLDYNGATARLVIANDVTEKVQVEAQNMERQKEIMQTIINTQEKERFYFGQELHDNIQQILAGCKIYIALALEADKTNNLLELTKKHLEEAIQETRNLSHRLAPASFKYKSLVEAIKGMLADFEKLDACKVSLDTKDYYANGLNDEIQLTLFRIIQEQLNNILKHAAAKNVELILKRPARNVLFISVRDDGKGFIPHKAENGIGLSNIKNRISLYKGKMNIISSPGAGCLLEITLQVDPTKMIVPESE